MFIVGLIMETVLPRHYQAKLKFFIMKTFIYILGILIATSCNNSMPQSQEEIEYQKFVSSVKMARNTSPSPQQRIILFEQVNKESGLQEFVVNSVQPGIPARSINELNAFYYDIIEEKYEGHPLQEQLKSKFISFAINTLDLTHADSQEETELLITYTREVIALNKSVDAELMYKCLSASKGKIEKEEYNTMIKRAKFQVRFAIEQLRSTLSTQKATDPKEPYQDLAEMIKVWEQTLVDLEGLAIK
jgi:hypothetical protein